MGHTLRHCRFLCQIAILFGLGTGLSPSASVLAAQPADIERDLTTVTKWATLEKALSDLKIPSVSIALIGQHRIAFARAYGQGATPDTLYQAASISKFVTAVGAVRLVEQNPRVGLDTDVNTVLATWRVPPNRFDKDHPVTLRGLLSMTAGIGVHGFDGYRLGARLPTLLQVLEGSPPANSCPVTVIAVPGTAFDYSGGGYEIAETLMVDTMKRAFIDGMEELVLNPAGMRNSTFAQPLPKDLEGQAAAGHDVKGNEIPGRFHVYPEHAAAGLWTTPSDIANLLLLVGQAWRGERHDFLTPAAAKQMLTPQNPGRYGLGVAIGDAHGSLVIAKGGSNAGYQSYLIFFPARGQGMVVMTNSDKGSILYGALIRRAAEVYNWPELDGLPD